MFEIDPLQMIILRYSAVLSIWLFVSLPLSRYFLSPEDFFVKKFRKKSTYITQRELIVRAFIGMGLIVPTSFVLGLAIIAWDIYRPALWPFVQLLSGLSLGLVTYLYFRFLKYRIEYGVKLKHPYENVKVVFVRRTEESYNALISSLLQILTYAIIPILFLVLTLANTLFE